MPTQSSSPYLPFGENKHAEWYGKDIISVKQFEARGPGIRLRSGARDARHGRARRHVRPAQGQDPGQPVLRTLHAHLVIVHCRHGAAGRLGHPDQRSEVFVGVEGRKPAGYRPHPGMLCGCDRAAPSRNGLGGDRGQGGAANPSSTRATAWANIPRRRCSIRSPSWRNWAGSTTSPSPCSAI